MSKPKFIFFKMLGCGHCVHFYESPSKDTSPWAQLVSDKALTSKVDFVLYEWGMSKNARGEVERHLLPEEYKFVNYGPYFYLQHATDAANGLEFKDAPRTYESMKDWILKNSSMFVSQPAPRNAPANIRRAVAQYVTGQPPVQQPAPAPQARPQVQARVPAHLQQTMKQQPAPQASPQIEKVKAPVQHKLQPVQSSIGGMILKRQNEPEPQRRFVARNARK